MHVVLQAAAYMTWSPGRRLQLSNGMLRLGSPGRQPWCLLCRWPAAGTSLDVLAAAAVARQPEATRLLRSAGPGTGGVGVGPSSAASLVQNSSANLAARQQTPPQPRRTSLQRGMSGRRGDSCCSRGPCRACTSRRSCRTAPQQKRQPYQFRRACSPAQSGSHQTSATPT